MKQIIVYLDEETLEKMDQMKKQIEQTEHVKSSRSDVIRRAIQKYLVRLIQQNNI